MDSNRSTGPPASAILRSNRSDDAIYSARRPTMNHADSVQNRMSPTAANFCSLLSVFLLSPRSLQTAHGQITVQTRS